MKWGTGFRASKKVAEMTAANVTVFNVAAKLEVPIAVQVYRFLDNMILMYDETDERSRLKALSENQELKKFYLQLLSNAYFNYICDIEVLEKEYPESLISKMPQQLREKLYSANVNKYFEISLVHEFSGQHYRFEFDYESSGTARFMELIYPMFLLYKSPGFFILDEIEKSLHPDLVKYFLQIFCEKCPKSQILFTSHLDELMDDDCLREDEIWFAKKNEKGETSLSYVTDYLGVRKGVSRKKLYDADKFGAKPIFGYPVFPGEVGE